MQLFHWKKTLTKRLIIIYVRYVKSNIKWDNGHFLGINRIKNVSNYFKCNIVKLHIKLVVQEVCNSLIRQTRQHSAAKLWICLVSKTIFIWEFLINIITKIWHGSLDRNRKLYREWPFLLLCDKWSHFNVKFEILKFKHLNLKLNI